MLTEFKQFILRGNVIDLAVAVVIGAAFGAIVTSLVTNIITPIIAAIFGQPDFSGLSFTLNGSEILYGAFLNSVIAISDHRHGHLLRGGQADERDHDPDAHRADPGSADRQVPVLPLRGPDRRDPLPLLHPGNHGGGRVRTGRRSPPHGPPRSTPVCAPVRGPLDALRLPSSGVVELR